MTIIPLLSIIAIAMLVAFYAWMFREMASDDTLPPGRAGEFSWPPATRADWFLVFVFMNVFGAAL